MSLELAAQLRTSALETPPSRHCLLLTFPAEPRNLEALQAALALHGSFTSPVLRISLLPQERMSRFRGNSCTTPSVGFSSVLLFHLLVGRAPLPVRAAQDAVKSIFIISGSLSPSHCPLSCLPFLVSSPVIRAVSTFSAS